MRVELCVGCARTTSYALMRYLRGLESSGRLPFNRPKAKDRDALPLPLHSSQARPSEQEIAAVDVQGIMEMARVSGRPYTLAEVIAVERFRQAERRKSK